MWHMLSGKRVSHLIMPHPTLRNARYFLSPDSVSSRSIAFVSPFAARKDALTAPNHSPDSTLTCSTRQTAHSFNFMRGWSLTRDRGNGVSCLVRSGKLRAALGVACPQQLAQGVPHSTAGLSYSTYTRKGLPITEPLSERSSCLLQSIYVPQELRKIHQRTHTSITIIPR